LTIANDGDEQVRKQKIFRLEKSGERTVCRKDKKVRRGKEVEAAGKKKGMRGE